MPTSAATPSTAAPSATAAADRGSGSLRAAAAMTLLGASTGVTALASSYPLAAGQALRYALASAVLLPLARRQGRLAHRPTARELGLLLALAGTGLFAFNLLMVTALRHTDASVVGSVVGCTPLLLGVLSPLLARRRPAPRLLAAAAVVVAGAALTQGFGSGDAVGLACATGTLLCEAAFSLLAVPLLPRLGPVRVSAYTTLLAVPMFAVTAALSPSALRAPTAAELLALLYLGLVLTCVAFLLWYSALTRLPADQAGLFGGLIPLTATLSGAVLTATAPTPLQFLGAGLVTAALVVRPARRPG
ncbi:DMT family transporter [Streptomyces sp. TLI_171]|uniref:DMT family transporter n=1 Tax=Streptomyces sp. TLI_171 TaxID=1938859 RepID=UPI000C3D50EF|nr:DMT family transporter [Streptomyces sp. TLI_171]RKE18117.1 threonine/homoserine efflux transporter RhtA [Streptomyces sp. TLI_171]